MLPKGHSHSQIYSFAVAAAALVANGDTPGLLRREISAFIKRLKAKLPAEAQAEIEAAEAEAAIKAAGYLRRGGSGD